MCTYKPRRHVVPAFILLFFCLGAISKAFALEVLAPQSKADYGSGASAANLYYPGGIPGMGLFLGQPNTGSRNDRALVRFGIAPHLLSGSPVDSATLSFRISAFCAPEDAHEIEITHLSYDANSFSVNDMLNARSEIVGIVSVKRKDLDPKDTNKEYSIDVTQYVNADIGRGNLYSAFRFKDVTAETKDRGTATSIYAVCIKNLPQLKIR